MEIAANYLWLAIFGASTLLERGIARSITILGSIVKKVSRSLGHGGAAASRPVLAGAAIISRQLGNSLVFAGNGFWVGMSVPTSLLVKGWEAVAIYPEEGTLWHDNPFAIPDVPWVNEVHREAAHLVEEYLRTGEVQARFKESGFRPGIYVDPADLLVPPQGLDLKQPEIIMGRVSAEAARAIQQSWNSASIDSDAVIKGTVLTKTSAGRQSRKQHGGEFSSGR